MTDPKKEINNTGGWAPGQGGSCQLPFASGPPLPGKSDSIAPEKQQILAAIRSKYSEVSKSASGFFQYPTGREGAEKLGYDPDLLNSLPQEVLVSFCGVGNPFGIAPLEPGSAVLDIGCGAGFDLIVARRLVGESGRVCGIDLTEEMVARARNNLTLAGFNDVEIQHVDGDALPYSDAVFDVVISNGVINLSPDKNKLFAEIHRVLKPGGRIQFADIVLERELPGHLIGSLEAWSQWIGGTVPVRDQEKLMRETGFVEVDCLGPTGFHTSEYTAGAMFQAKKPAW